MRIVIDLQGAQASNKNRGIGRYSLSLAQAMIREADGKHEFWIALSRCFPESIEQLRDSFKDLLPGERIVVWDAPCPVADIDPENHWRREVGEHLREGFLASLNPDVVYVSSLFEGLGDNALTSVGIFESRFKTVVTLYDLIPLVHREKYLSNPAFEAWYERKLTHLRRSDLLLAISESSRQEGISWLNLPEDKVVNISAAIDDKFHPLKLSSVKIKALCSRYGLPRHEFVMYTGGIDIRKNMEGLIRAYALLNKKLRKDYPLVMVCRASEKETQNLKQLSKHCGLSDDEVIFTGFVSDEDLVALYSLCTVFIFPSWHEGFGLPALEAMSCGAAVIASNTSSLPEVMGREDILFNPHNEKEIAQKLEETLVNRAFRQELKSYGLQQARRFSWKESACRALNSLEKLHAEDQKLSQSQPQTRGMLKTRPLLAYVSPLPPEETGIADYSAELLPELARHYEIEVVTDQPEISDSWINANCIRRTVEWFDQNASRYDRVLYHFGNSAFHQHMFGLLAKHPGTVVLHDFFLSGVISHLEYRSIIPGFWASALYVSHGYSAVRERYRAGDGASVIWNYPCSLGVIKNSNGIIVHSQYAKDLAEQWYGKGSSIDWVKIPHLRGLPQLNSFDRRNFRASLGVKETDFLVCSFGVIGSLKLNHRLLSAWVNSPLAQNSLCHLVFVGSINAEGAYGKSLLESISLHQTSNIKITGFAPPELYRSYLAAADFAVQLRTLTRGETSGTVLDCMGYGLPFITNAHGSMQELPEGAALVMPDHFTEEELVEAMVKLWHGPALRHEMGLRGKQHIFSQHHPWEIGNQYKLAIEEFSASGPHAIPMKLAKVLSKASVASNDAEIVSVAKAIAFNHSSECYCKRLLVDISELVQRDAQSGIQRVVRSILIELLTHPPEGFRVEPVYLKQDGIYYYARQFTFKFMGMPNTSLSDDPIETSYQDIFIGLDLFTNFPKSGSESLKIMKQRGIRIFFVVYDLLCVNRPEFFVEGAFDLFTRWLRHVTTYADGFLGISRATAEELSDWLKKNAPQRLEKCKIGWFHLGADIENSLPSEGSSPESDLMLSKMEKQLNVLMVSTIEPRKGHLQALKAFELLWSKGLEANLVIVGSQGWMVEELIDRLQSHPRAGKNLFWFKKASDSVLQQIYEMVDGLLVASEAERFGLALIEAARMNVPILARDIPVFREVAGEHATYFSGNTADSLAEALKAWLELLIKKEAIQSGEIPWLTWAESTRQLLKQIIPENKK